MAASQTITVPHLGGIRAGYAISGDGHIDPLKPTYVLLNSMCMTVALYRDQFANKALTDTVNLLAIEPLGHGATTLTTTTSCYPTEEKQQKQQQQRQNFTYWDSAIMALQVMDALGVDTAYALGTSQGGWIVVRMALLAPWRIQGLVLLGTSMDYESAESRAKGCWDSKTLLGHFLDKWSLPSPSSSSSHHGSAVTEAGQQRQQQQQQQQEEEFIIDEEWCGMVGSVGFGDHGTPEKTAFWTGVLREVYKGEEGRNKAQMALLNLITRDGLLLRLGDVKCPVHWLQGTKDIPYGTTVPEEHIRRFTSVPRAELTLVPDGGHYLNATNPVEVANAMLDMINKT